jgi:hypothetical protein
MAAAKKAGDPKEYLQLLEERNRILRRLEEQVTTPNIIITLHYITLHGCLNYSLTLPVIQSTNH